MRSLGDRQPRPELRRPRRGDVALFVVHASLDRSAPAIWRRLELRSDLRLSLVHDALQAAFAWEDRHLHRFALGGDPFAPESQLFLCPFDVQEGEDDGVPAADVRLDEVVSEPDDELAYVYDYGDGWQITLRLEEIRSPEASSPPAARVVGGERAAPPEDCGGRLTAEELAEVIPDPARLDLAALGGAVRRSVTVLGQDEFRHELLELLDRATRSPGCEDLVARAKELTVEGPRAPTDDQRREGLGATLWFLDRAAGDGIPLTAAGYLTPADVEAATDVVPAAGDWIGARNREVHVRPVLWFRETLQRVGLLRKHKGRLLLTPVGRSVQQEVDALWHHLATRLSAHPHGSYELEATLVLLVHLATSVGERVDPWAVATVLGGLGWRNQDGGAPDGVSVTDLDAWWVLGNVGPMVRTGLPPVSVAAAALARDALRPDTRRP